MKKIESEYREGLIERNKAIVKAYKRNRKKYASAMRLYKDLAKEFSLSHQQIIHVLRITGVITKKE